MPHQRFAWKRFWCPRGGNVHLGDDGFLIDPEMECGRTLQPDLVPFEHIKDTPCLVLLGEPGIGKTTVLEDYHKMTSETAGQSSSRFLRKNLNTCKTESYLAKFLFEDPGFVAWEKGDHLLYLFLDSFDECLIRIDTLANLLPEELRQWPVERLRLRIACRTAVWPGSLEEHLRRMWGEQGVGTYELAPLRRCDVVEAADQSGINARGLLRDIDDRAAAPFAIKPVTLCFLLNVYLKCGSIPQKKEDLYLRGCELLCGETNQSRNEAGLTGTLTPRQRLAIAARVAAMSVFCGRPLIQTGPDLGDFPDDTLSCQDVVGGTESERGHLFPVTDAHVREVLDTGLFSGRANDGLGFAHQTYAEFLAAHYLRIHSLNTCQLLGLITHPGDATGRIVPQLRETAAWLADFMPDVFNHIVQADPQVLLGSDDATMGEGSRETLVESLLRQFDAQEAVDSVWEDRRKYRKLQHPGLAEQLRPFVRNRAGNVVARRFAVDLAEECGLGPLQGDLADIVLDGTEDLRVREQAAHALGRKADDSTLLRLKPCALGQVEDDADDELKGVALSALWPRHLAVEEVFDALTRPRRFNVFRAYDTFLRKELPASLPDSALALATRWAVAQSSEGPYQSPLGSLADAILRRAWECLAAPGVLEPYAEATAKRIENHDKLALPEIVLGTSATDPRRYLLLQAVAPLLVRRQVTFASLLFGPTRLVHCEDLPWLAESARGAREPEIRGFWARLAATVYSRERTDQTEVILALMPHCEELVIAFLPLLQTVELNSVEAEGMRTRYREGQRQERLDLPAPLALVTAPRERVAELLAKFEAGATDAWWHLNLELTLSPTSTHYGDDFELDLTTLPGWAEADAPTRGRILKAARRYLDLGQRSPENRSATTGFLRPDLAAYRAFLLLAKEEAEALKTLPPPIWRRWAAIIVGCPTIMERSNDRQHQELVMHAYRHAPDEVITTLRAEIARQSRDQQWVSLHRKVELCWDDTLAAMILEVARDQSLKLTHMASLLEQLLERRFPGALKFATSLIALPMPQAGEDRQRAELAAGLLLVHVPDQAWEALWETFRADAGFAREVVTEVASRHDQLHAAQLCSCLSEKRVGELYEWLARVFPTGQDPKLMGFHQIGPREAVAHFQEAVLRQLVSRATSEAVCVIRHLADVLPESPWLRWVAVEARTLALRRTWEPPEPAELIQLIRDRARRLVRSGDELLDVLVESLKRLESELQGENPGAPDLWNKLTNGSYRPKDENAFSDYVVRHLRRDLRERGIIANREVEIRRGEGKSRGERTDIHVDAIAKDGDSAVCDCVGVIIETKGCWNKGLKKDMERQLRDRYLKDSLCRHGLYLVGWFRCHQWDSEDANNTQSPKWPTEKARRFFDEQAVKLSDESIHICAYVLDATLR